MSILNLGLQNCLLGRKQSEDKFEEVLKRCGSIKRDMREGPKCYRSEGFGFGLMLNVPVNNFSVMLGRSHHFLGSTFFFFWGGGGGVNMSCSRTQRLQSRSSQDETYLMKWHLREMFPDLDLDFEI